MYPSRNTHAKSYTNPTQRQGKDTAKRTAFLHKISHNSTNQKSNLEFVCGRRKKEPDAEHKTDRPSCPPRNIRVRQVLLGLSRPHTVIMNVQSNTTRSTNEAPPPPGRSSRSEHIEVVLRATQDLMEKEDRAAGKLPTETTNATATTKQESGKTGVADNQQDKRAAVAKSTDDSNTPTTLPPTSTVQDDHSTQSDEKQEPTVAQNSHGEQQPDKPSDDMEHKSTTADDVTSIEAGLVGQPVPSSGGGSGWQALALFNHGELVDENEEEQQQRRAEFAAQRQRHLLADSLQAHYDAILADVSAAAESDDDDEEQQEEPQPHQDNNNEENATASDPNATRRPERHHLAVAMDLFMHMEADDEELDETESESDSE